MWSQRNPLLRKNGIGNIFIKNLDPKIEHQDLYDTFSQFGNILSCKVATDESGKSKGYGFVHFESQKAAEQAIKTVNHNQLLTKKVFVGPFIPRRVREEQRENSWTNVYVKDLDPEISDETFAEEFGKFGPITSPKVMRGEDGSSKGFAFCNFQNHEDAVRCVKEMQGKQLGNKVVFCCRAQKKAERRAKLKKEWEEMKFRKYQGINLYIKNLEDHITEDRLKKEFSVFGTIKSHKIMMDKGQSKGFGFVCFSTPEEAQLALQKMNTRILQGCTKPLYVAFHEAKEFRRQKLNQRYAYKSAMHSVPGNSQGPVPGYAQQPIYYPQNNFVPYATPQMVPPMARTAWNQQGYPPMYNNTAAVMVQRGGNNSNRGGRGGQNRRNPEQAQAQSQAQASQAQVQAAPAELTIQTLSQFPPEHQKLILGERLYPKIEKLQPQLAGKITGMFLESGWPIKDLYLLLTDNDQLTARINEAISILESSNLTSARNPAESTEEPTGQ